MSSFWVSKDFRDGGGWIERISVLKLHRRSPLPPPPAHRALQCRASCPVQARGTLPPDIARLSHLETLNLEGQALSGGVPTAWFEADAWPGLRNLFLSGNPLGGALTATQPGALRELAQLRLSNCSLEGPLPLSWGRDDTSMRHLNVL